MINSINSAAVKNPRLIAEDAELFGSQCVVLAIDARRRDKLNPAKGWEVYINGGRIPTGLDVIEWVIKAKKLGAGGF